MSPDLIQTAGFQTFLVSCYLLNRTIVFQSTIYKLKGKLVACYDAEKFPINHKIGYVHRWSMESA